MTKVNIDVFNVKKDITERNPTKSGLMLPYMTKEGTSKIRISIYGPVNKLFLDQTDEYLTDLQFTTTINLKYGSSWIRD